LSVESVDPREVDRRIRNAFGKTEKKLQNIGLSAIYRYDRDGHYLIISLRSITEAIKGRIDPIVWDYMSMEVVEDNLIVYCPRGEFIVERAREKAERVR